MKYFTWNTDKNAKLKRERGISFEEVVLAVEQDGLLDVVEHPNTERYGRQRILVVNINRYAWLVPFVETDDEIFLKTIIPSRKATKKYLTGGKNNEDKAG